MTEEKKELRKDQYYVFKANVPFNDTEEMSCWNKSCQSKLPEGHNDYRWGKMISDHLFVKNFKKHIMDLQDKQNEIMSFLEKIDKKLDTKQIKDKNSELFGN